MAVAITRGARLTRPCGQLPRAANVRSTSNSDRTGASQRTAALCQEATYAPQQKTPAIRSRHQRSRAAWVPQSGSAPSVLRLMTNSSLVGCSTGRSSLAVATKRRPLDSHPHAVGQRRPARTRHRAICDDDYHTNLVRTAPLLRADMIFGKDRSERAALFLTTRRLATSARTMAQPFVRCAPSSSCFAGLRDVGGCARAASGPRPPFTTPGRASVRGKHL